MNSDARIIEHQQKLAQVKARCKALKDFMAEARLQEGDLFSCIIQRELDHDLPGTDVGLTISFDC